MKSNFDTKQILHFPGVFASPQMKLSNQQNKQVKMFPQSTARHSQRSPEDLLATSRGRNFNRCTDDMQM